MRKVGIQVAVGCVVLAAVGAGGLTLISSADEGDEEIQVATAEVVTGLDPAGVYDSGSWALFSNLYQSLMTFTPGTLQPVPDAATGCDFENEKLLTYVCTLRPGLRFSNGHELTASDVKFSFDRIKGIRDQQGPSSLLSTLAKVRTEGPRKIIFELRTPDATFPYKIATGAGSIVDEESYAADKVRTDNEVVGSGPYVLTEYKDGERAVLRANDKYEGAAGDADAKPVTVRYFDSAAALHKAWKAHEVDVVGSGMPPAELAKINPADPNIKVMEGAAPVIRTLVLDIRKDAPMGDRAVRRAVAAVIDREALVRDVHQRTVDPLYSLIPQGVNGHKTPFHDNFPKPDADQARAILRAAGHTKPVTFTLGYPEGKTHKAEAELLRKQLEATGLFTVKMERRSWEDYQNSFANHEFDAWVISWVADFPDPDTFTTPLVGPDPVWPNGYRNKRVQQLILNTQREDERTATVGDFRTIQRIVADDVPMIPLWQQKEHVLSTSSISGTEYLSDGTGMWRLWKLDRI